MTILILASREVGQNHLFTRNLDSPLVIPYSGKPIFSHYESQFRSHEIIYAVNENSKFTQKLISIKSPERKILTIPRDIAVNKTGETLLYCLELLKFPSNILVLYGDNLYSFKELPITSKENIIYTYQFSDAYPSYSYFSIEDERVIVSREKLDFDYSFHLDTKHKLNTGAIFLSSTYDLPNIRNVDLIELLSTKKFVLENLDSWIDVGHQDLLFRSDASFDSREFNSLSFSKDRLSIIKKSSNPKIRSELNHLENIPKPFTFLFPRVQRDLLKKDEYQIEYWPLRPLAEYLCFWKLHNSMWNKVLTKVLNSLMDFREFKAERNELQQATDANNEIYLNMFLDRTSRVSFELTEMMSCSSFILNGVRVEGVPKFIERFKSDLVKVGSSLQPSFYHGDLCLSNILYSPEEQIMKFIDPKGSMFDHSPYLGDIRYDLAKLLHSLCYGYDFINYELSHLQHISGEVFSLNLIGFQQTKSIQKSFNGFLEERFLPEMISASKILTAMLFFCLLPLHQESLEKQRSFFFIGLMLLNEIYSDSEMFEKVFN